MTHAEQISSKLNVKPTQVTAVINLLDDEIPIVAGSEINDSPSARFSARSMPRAACT